jgi:hypothetical protein
MAALGNDITVITQIGPLSATTLSITIKDTRTVADLKAEISAQSGFPIEIISITLDGKMINNEDISLDDAGIKNGSRIVLKLDLASLSKNKGGTCRKRQKRSRRNKRKMLKK